MSCWGAWGGAGIGRWRPLTMGSWLWALLATRRLRRSYSEDEMWEANRLEHAVMWPPSRIARVHKKAIIAAYGKSYYDLIMKEEARSPSSRSQR